MAVKLGIRNYSRSGNNVTFTVAALNADGTIDRDFRGTVSFVTNNVLSPGEYRFMADDAGQRTFTVTFSNPNPGVSFGIQVFASDDTASAILYGAPSSGSTFAADTRGDHILIGGGSADFFDGNAGDDLFLVQSGGNDTVIGGPGNDGFYFGAAYTSADTVDGGDGNLDQIGLQGNYAGNVTLGSIAGVEMIVLLPGNDTRFGDTANNFYDYRITTINANIAAGQTLIFQANTLRAGEDFTLNAAAETDGNIIAYGGFGVDNLRGGAGNDGFFFGQGRFGTSDVVNGGAGTMDQLGLQGNFAGGNRITFGATQLTSIEGIVLLSASDNRFGASGGIAIYELIMNDGNVAAGQRMMIQGNTLQTGETLTFNGSAETNGAFDIYSGNDFDVIIGGRGDDLIFGGGGGDTLTGGAGNDIFAYNRLTDSNSVERDNIQDFTLGDKIDLSRLDADVTLAGKQDFRFIGTSNFIGFSAGQLRYENISQGPPIYLIQGDVNGDNVSDFEIIYILTDGHRLTVDDFIGVTGPNAAEALLKPMVAEDFAMPDELYRGFDIAKSHHIVLPPLDLAL